MNLAKVRAYFAAIAAAIAYLVIPSASAAILGSNDFESSYDGFTADIGSVGEAATLTNYNSDQPSATAPYPFSGFGSKYLAVDTGDATLYREFAEQTSSTYFDAYMQFEPMSGEISYTNVAKIVVYLDAATSNLCIISGTSANDRTPVTNRLTSAVVEPGTWGRLTVNAFKATSDSVFSFNVRLNDTMLTNGSTDTFYSLTAGNAVSRVGFKGTGALDNLVARTTDPYIAPEDIKATCNGESYATVGQALDEANGAQVTLAANHPDTVAVTKSGTYKVDKGSCEFGGVVGTDGSYVTSSTSGNVDTYTVKLLVTVWDGATAAYNFSTLTRTLGDNTYTLNLNSQNTVGGDGAYVQIGPNNAQKAITLTANGVGAFGTNGQVTVIMKCSALNLTDNTYRGLIGLLSDEGGYYSGDNNVKIGIATGWNVSNGAGVYTPYIANGVQNSYSQNATAYTTDEQTICMTYNSASGTCIYRDGSLNASSTGIKYGTWMSPVGIVFGGMDKDSSSRVNAQTGMKIEAIAVFSSMLSAEEVAAYTFPSETPMSGTVTVSDINALFGTKSDITVHLADGTTVTGDTTFNASTVNFVCDGSFTMTAPAGNTATFDFSGVTGNPVFVYNGVTPEVSGDTFTSNSIPTWVTDSSQWTGTVWIKNKTITDFNPSNFGNIASTLRLSGVYAYFKDQTTPLVLNPTIELVNGGYNYGLNVYNGYSRDTNTPGRYITFNKLKGDGELWTSGFAGNVLMNVLDWSDFSGKIQLVNKIVVFGSEVPAIGDFNTSGSIYIPSGVTVTIPAGKQWRADGGVHIHGTFKATDIGENQLKNTTTNFTYDTGTFVLMTNSDIDDLDVNYGRITGTGTLRYEGANYRTISRNNFPTTMTVENNLETSGLIHRVPSTELTIGSLSGNGRMRSDWSGSGNIGDRDLRILQATNTTYSGLFDNVNDRIRTVYVAPGASSAGTLTLSNAQTASNDLDVVSGAKVNLTGTWKGAVRVAGTFGGTGMLTGNLTFSAGSTFKAFATDENGLSVSGTVAYPASGTVAVDISDVTVPAAGVMLITGGTVPADTSKLTVAEGYVLRVESNALKVYPAAARPETLVNISTVVTAEWKTANGLPADATDEQIQAKMREIDANGNAKWQNLVLGQDGSQSTAVVVSTNGTETTAVIGLTFTPPANSGYTVKYALDKVDRTGAVVESAAEQATPSIDLTQVAAGATAYFKVRAVLTNEYVGSSVAVEKIIGVTRVDSTSEYTIVGVPWASFGDGDIKVCELLHVGNRNEGDVLMAYDPVNKDYKTGTWTLSADKVWEPTTVTKETESGDSESGTATAADLNTIKRGSGVWLKRVNTANPIYLLGQVSNVTATVTLENGTSSDPSWNLVASSSAEALDLNNGLSITPSAGDKIKVPTAIVPIDYTYRNGRWGYWNAEIDSNGISRDVWVDVDVTVPAGRGFWYLNTGTDKTLGL